MYRAKRSSAFTLIEFLIALVIIGFIVAILVGVFSSPLKQAKTDSAVSQVKDGLRQIVEASQLMSVSSSSPHVEASSLAAGGYLTAAPAIPAGIDGVNGAAVWDYESGLYYGGCGGSSSGKQAYDVPWLGPVSLDFCKAYNKAQGLAEAPVPNCATGDCTASGGSESSDPESAPTTTFCFDYGNDDYVVVYQTNSAPAELCP